MASQSWSYQLKVMFLGDVSKSKEERRLVQKLDLFVLTYCCLSYFFNYLDRAAFANAYVAGLKEDIGLHGAQYNVLLSMMTAGYVIGQIPHGIVIQKIPPRIWLPSMVALWAGLTMCTAACKTYEQLCVVRFFQGIAEASTYCGTMYIVGSWYKPQEIAKRTAIFTAVGQAGSMFAGVMMTAIHQSMNGYAGMPGWKWVFLIDGIITLPVAIAGFLFFPDIPENTKPSRLGLNAPEIALSISRLPRAKPDAHNIAPLSLLKRTLGQPHLYVLGAFSLATGALEAYCVQSLFLLWLKHHAARYASSQITTYPLGVQAVGIAANIAAALYIDASGHRVPVGLLAAALQLVVAVLLLVPGIPPAATFFAFYLAGTSYMVNPLLFGWANVILKRSGDEAVRGVVLYWMNAVQSALYTFWGIALYPADEAPYWRKGGVAMCVVCVVMVGMLWVVKWLDRKSIAEQIVVGEEDEEEEEEGVTEVKVRAEEGVKC
ncbi:major facilitator superfamily transporter [Neofusicoccum parvum]|uniref:Major facilitator superfamily transporter n=1 Tax=Neofusicoccum parvum TaxID=310453 RepID=A0ACB5S7W7_9PEZI|nr:major facilitator superfamily transporter [Neofusicoccum parvum]